MKLFRYERKNAMSKRLREINDKLQKFYNSNDFIKSTLYWTEYEKSINKLFFLYSLLDLLAPILRPRQKNPWHSVQTTSTGRLNHLPIPFLLPFAALSWKKQTLLTVRPSIIWDWRVAYRLLWRHYKRGYQANELKIRRNYWIIQNDCKQFELIKTIFTSWIQWVLNVSDMSFIEDKKKLFEIFFKWKSSQYSKFFWFYNLLLLLSVLLLIVAVQNHHK